MKVVLPSNPNAARHEITALRLADGEGCAALLRDDPELGALLLERLGTSLFKLGLPVAQRLEILCDTVTRMWRAAPDCGLPTGADRARRRGVFIAETWEKLDRPCSEQAIDHALGCAHRRERAHDAERAVLVHGDVDQLNALEAGEDFKLIDPDRVLAEAECDLGILMRGDPVELLDGDPRQRARWLAARTGHDATAIWEWGVIERVASGLPAKRSTSSHSVARRSLRSTPSPVSTCRNPDRHPLRPFLINAADEARQNCLIGILEEALSTLPLTNA